MIGVWRLLLPLLLGAGNVWIELEARPQDPMETAGQVAMAAVSSMMDTVGNGAAARNEQGMKTDFVELQSKSEVGMGEAIRRERRSYDVDDESMGNSTALEHPHEHRGKRSPCHTSTSGGTSGDTDAEEIAERRRKALQKKAAKSRKKQTTAKKSKKTTTSRRRRRRQTNDIDQEQASDKTKQVAEKVRGVVETIVNTMKDMVQAVKKAFGGGEGSGDGSDGNGGGAV